MPYLGESGSKPIVARVRVKINGNDNGGVGFERWVAIVTGGYDRMGDPNDTANYDPTAIAGRAIMMIDPKSGELLAMKRYDSGATDAQADMLYLTFGSGERMSIGFFGIPNRDENNRFYSMTDLDPYERRSTLFPTLDEFDLAEVNDNSTCADVSGRGFFFRVRDGEKSGADLESIGAPDLELDDGSLIYWREVD